jgi:hypothetical protein
LLQNFKEVNWKADQEGREIKEGLHRWMGDVELDLSNMEVKRERENWIFGQNKMVSFVRKSQGQT